MKFENTAIIPLLRTRLTVLPGEPVPLRLAAAEEQALLRCCLTGGASGEARSFGVSLCRPKAIEPIGCEVEIRSILRTYKNGACLVLAWGLRRYRLLEQLSGGDCPKARVVYLDDLRQGVSPELQEKAVDLYGRIAGQEGLAEEELPNTSEWISYQLASQIQLEQAERQELLNQPSEKARLEKLCEIFRFRSTAIRHSSVAASAQGYIQ